MPRCNNGLAPALPVPGPEVLVMARRRSSGATSLTAWNGSSGCDGVGLSPTIVTRSSAMFRLCG